MAVSIPRRSKQLIFRKLTPEAQTKGEEFVQFLLDEGFTWQEMKGAFHHVSLRRLIKNTGGVLVCIPESVKGLGRNEVYRWIKFFQLGQLVDQVRTATAGAAAKPNGKEQAGQR